MDVFRRLTNPTLKKLYRFVLKRLVGRFLDDDISLEQIDVRLGAGRVELTDLNINVRTISELLPPGLSFRLARAHVGRLRVEISYSKLLTESLAVFLDDVIIEVEPQPHLSNLDEDEARMAGKDVDDATATRDVLNEGDVADGYLGTGNAGPVVVRDSKAKGSSRADSDQAGEAGERLDILAQWIDQITSKVQVVVNRLTVRVASAVAQLESADVRERTCGDTTSMLCFVLRCSYLRWCDETPDVSSFVADQSSPAGIERAEGPGKGNGGALFVHKRLTLGLLNAELDDGQQAPKANVLRIGGTGSVAIKHCPKHQLGSPGDVLDVDISLRQADVTLDTDECTGLCTLLAAYLTRTEEPSEDIDPDGSVVVTKPIKPLFHEDFWYLEGSSNNNSGDLNFDTLSSLLEQYADARARLAGDAGYGQGILGAGSLLSLGQSDVFYDCQEGNDDIGGGSGARPDRCGSMKFRLRMTGLDITLLLAQDSMGPLRSRGSPSASLRFQMRRMSQTLLCDGEWMQSVAEIGTFVADWSDRNARGSRRVRVMEVINAADTSPSVQISCTAGAETAGAVTRGETGSDDELEVSLTVGCLPVAAVLDPGLVQSLSDFFGHVRPPVDGTDGGCGGGNGQGASPSGRSVREPRVVVAVSVPELAVRIPADDSACSSDAHTALVRSVQNGTSPVGWAPREELADEVTPMLVLEVEGVMVRNSFGSTRPQETALECTRVACQLLLLGSYRADDGGGEGLIGLYFLEASCSSAGVPLKVEFGLAKDIRKAGQSDLARPGRPDLNFLHTWEPNDGVDSGLEDVPPSGSFGGGLPSAGCSAAPGVESSPRILFFVLPRLAVELSRLELVVLADVLAGFAPRSDGAESTSSPGDHFPYAPDPDATQPHSLEVVVEACGATVVLHEATDFAEDPGPHSFVLNLGDACLHVGGSNKSIEGNPAPLVTLSAGDVCVHETLRFSQNSRLSTPEGRRISGPLLFSPGTNVSAYPMVEDLPPLGFVPVLYQTKWAKGTSPVAAELALGVSGPGTVFKTITATLNLYDVSLRHTVSSSWLPRLLGLVVGDVPAGKASSSRNCETSVGPGADGVGEAGGSLTKMFITVFNGVVDYMPQSQGPSRGCPRRPSTPSGVAAGAPIGVLPPTEGRAVFPIGVLRVSSNMVAGAAVQGFKVVIRDIGLHMSNRVMDYSNEDFGLCRGALEARRRPLVAPTKTDFSSVQEFLESSHFVQIATLNFLDAFLRTRSQVVAPSDAFTAVELWMGVVHVYTCQDSLSTCQALLGEWWALMNEVRAAAAVAVAVDVGKTGLSTPERQTGRVARDKTQQGAPTSLLDDVEQDAFLPGSSKGSPKVGEDKVDPDASATTSNGFSGQLRKQSLVIEDYYCVSVEPTDARADPGLLLGDAADGSREQQVDVEDPTPGQDSSFLSEGEGPAQWLAAPKVDLNHGDTLSMESADDTSDSEGEEEHEAQGVGSSPPQSGVTRRSNFGFSLPAPIEIELEDRHEPANSEVKKKEVGDATTLRTIEQAPSSPELGDWRSEGTDPSSQGDEDLPGLSPQRGATNIEGQTLVESPGMPESESLSRQNRNSSPFRKQKGSPSWTASVSAVEVPRSPYGDQSAKVNGPAKDGPVQGEQQARWLGRDRETPSDGIGAAGIGRCASSHDPEDFRVYPHYVPIPTTAEATSLPFLSGDPLLALGHDLEKNAEGEAEIGGSERIDQKLQFQLAIHDLSICWRLFKGRDWSGRNASQDRNRVSRQTGGDDQRHQRGSTRGPPSRGVAEGKFRDHENESESVREDVDIDTSSTGEGGRKPRKVELLDALLENYQDEKGGHGEAQIRRRASRQPKVKLLNLPRESGSSRTGKRTGRDTSCMLEVVLEHSSLRLDSFHPGPPPSLLSNLLFSIKDLHASDTLTSSRPRKTLHHWRDDRRHPREFQHKMVTVRMTTRSPSNHFCPEDAPLGDEIMLKVRLLPIHLSFGQHTVDFLRSFSPPQEQSDPSAQDKHSTVVDYTDAADDGAGPLFISCCDVGSFKVKIDYQPRAIRVGALQSGDYLELLNLFPLEGVHLTLQKLLLTGVSGWDSVTQLLLQSWVQDIASNQLHKFLAGTTAVRPLVTVGKGVADLVLLPVEQYRRDGRVFRGLRKGTQSFLRAITIETLHTSHRVASYISRTLDDIVTQPGAHASLRGLEYYDEQPTGVIDSLEHAYDALAKEVQVAAQTIIAIPYEDQEEVVGPHGRSYVRSVARALPVAVLRPVVGASEALSCTLLGFRNAMAPRMRKEEEMRWS